jgi:error-prone DNA polymerase
MARSLADGTRLREGSTRQSAEALATSPRKTAPFRSAEDLALRVPVLNRKELTLLAQIGALNKLDGIRASPRCALAGGACRQTGRAAAPAEQRMAAGRFRCLPLAADERRGAPGRRLCRNWPHGRQTPHALSPGGIASQQCPLRRRNCRCRDGEFVRTAGCVIARQRPGTAKGFIFISMEDETGIANVIVTPDLYERDRLVVTRSKFLAGRRSLQNQDNVIHVKATRLTALSIAPWKCGRMIFIEEN